MALSIKRLSLCAAGISALCSVCFGQIVKTKTGYLLRSHYVKGMVINYDSATSVKGGGTSIPAFHIGIKIEVIKVNRGIGTVRITQGAVKVGGSEVMHPSTLEVSLDSRNVGNTKGSNAIGPPLPPLAVRPGSTWEAVIPVTLLGNTKAMKMRYQFSGMTHVKNQSMGLILFTVGGAVEGEGKMFIRASDGTVESSEMTLNLGKGLGGVSSKAMMQAHFLVKRL